MFRANDIPDRDQYLPQEDDRSSPVASPLLAPDESFQSCVNRVYIAVAELDLLRSEGEAYAAKLRSFGKDVDFRTYPGVPHAVQAMDGVLDVARRWIKDMCVYVAMQFGKHQADVMMEVSFLKHARAYYVRNSTRTAWKLTFPKLKVVAHG